MELNGNLVLVSSVIVGLLGLCGNCFTLLTILLIKMLLPYPSGTNNSVDFCLVIELNSQFMNHHNMPGDISISGVEETVTEDVRLALLDIG